MLAPVPVVLPRPRRAPPAVPSHSSRLPAQSVPAQRLRCFLAWVWPDSGTGTSTASRAGGGGDRVHAGVGASWRTVAAAQSSLPDSPLYRIKLTAEDTRQALTQDPARQTTLAMGLAGKRIREMEQLSSADRPISAQVTARLEAHLDAALSAARQAPDAEMARLLEQVRASTQVQERALARAQVNAPQSAGSQAGCVWQRGRGRDTTARRGRPGRSGCFRAQMVTDRMPGGPTLHDAAVRRCQSQRRKSTTDRHTHGNSHRGRRRARRSAHTALPAPRHTRFTGHRSAREHVRRRSRARHRGFSHTEATPNQAGLGPEATGTPTEGPGGPGGTGTPRQGDGTRHP